jgi:hypothetical protein
MGQKCKPTKLLELEKGKLYSDQRDRQEYEPVPVKELNPGVLSGSQRRSAKHGDQSRPS